MIMDYILPTFGSSVSCEWDDDDDDWDDIGSPHTNIWQFCEFEDDGDDGFQSFNNGQFGNGQQNGQLWNGQQNGQLWNGQQNGQENGQQNGQRTTSHMTSSTASFFEARACISAIG